MVEAGSSTNANCAQPNKTGGQGSGCNYTGQLAQHSRDIKSGSREIGFLKDLVQYLAQLIVDEPDNVEVTETHTDNASVLELKVAKEDLGRVIGKQGRTAKSLRTIVNAAAAKKNQKVVLEIMDKP